MQIKEAEIPTAKFLAWGGVPGAAGRAGLFRRVVSTFRGGISEPTRCRTKPAIMRGSKCGSTIELGSDLSSCDHARVRERNSSSIRAFDDWQNMVQSALGPKRMGWEKHALGRRRHERHLLPPPSFHCIQELTDMPGDTVTSMFQFVCFSLLCGEITPAKDPYTPPPKPARCVSFRLGGCPTATADESTHQRK